MSARPLQHKERGFTLIELLVGAVISAVMLAALYSLFHGILRAQARAYSDLEEIAPRGQVIATLKNDLENMVIPSGVLSGAILGQTEGQGDRRADTLEFCSASGRIDDTLPWGDIQKVSYSLAETEQEGDVSRAQLLRSVTRNLLPATPDDQSETSVLLDGVGTLEFQYYDGQTWADIWDSTAVENALPKAVRARVGFPTDEGKGVTMKPIEIVCEIAAQKAEASASSATGATSGAAG